MAARLLSSWKEIAQHLGRSVRTAQRWERELGLPVRRPRGGDASIVLADSEELTAWVQKQTRGERARTELELIELRNRCAVLEAEIALLTARCQELEQMLTPKPRLERPVSKPRAS